MDAHQTQGCIVQQMDAYMGFAGLKTVKKVHCHGVLFCYEKGLTQARTHYDFASARLSASLRILGKGPKSSATLRVA